MSASSSSFTLPPPLARRTVPADLVGRFGSVTTPDISVRTATDADAARLAEIRIAAWRATYRGVMTDAYLDGLDVGRATTAWRQNILEPKDGIFQLVVQSGPQVVGFAILGPAAGDSDAGTGQLYAINVHPDWWAHGVGSVLFAAAEQKFIELGYRRAFLWVDRQQSGHQLLQQARLARRRSHPGRHQLRSARVREPPQQDLHSRNGPVRHAVSAGESSSGSITQTFPTLIWLR